MSKRYPGVRAIIPGQKYEIFWQMDNFKRQHRILVSSEKEASLIRAEELAEYRKRRQIPEGERDRLTSTFAEIWERLKDDVLADNLAKKTLGRYEKTFWRMFGEFREKYFPGIKSPGQLTLSFFREYKNFYSNDLGRERGVRAELIIAKSIAQRLYLLGYVQKDLIERLQEIKKPAPRRKSYPDINTSKINELLSFVRKDRPDYFQILYFIFRTGRRIAETTSIEKRDVILKGFKPVAINIRAEITKTRTSAPLPYLDEALERHVRIALNSKKGKWLFCNRKGNQCTPGRVCDYLKRVSREILGVTITPHYFRHRLCVEGGKRNTPIADLKQVTGIRDTDVLLGYYSHGTSEGIRQVLEITA